MSVSNFFLILLFSSLLNYSYGQNAPVELIEKKSNSSQNANPENRSDDIKKVLYDFMQETLYLRNVDYESLKENKAVSACLPLGNMNKDFLHRGLFDAIGYSTEEINENSAISKAYNICEKTRIQNGLNDICECNTIFLNNNFILDVRKNLETNIFLKEHIKTSNKKNNLERVNVEINDDIQVDDIPNDFNKWFGSISSDEGGLGWLMWDGTSYDTVRNVLSFVSTVSSSQTTVGLTKKLLLSRSKSPQKAISDNNLKAVAHDGEELEVTQKDNFELLYKKIAILSRLGLTSELDGLIKNIPSGVKPKGFEKKIFDIRVINNDTVNTCKNINKFLTLDVKNNIYRKILIVCQILRDENEKALLSIDLLENDVGDKDVFLKLTKLLLNDSNSVKNTILSLTKEIDRNLVVGLSAAFSNKILLENLEGSELNAANKITAYFKKGNLQNIILAAEKAVQLRMLDPVYLAEIYASVFIEKNKNFNISPEELKQNSPFIRAKLFVLSTMATSSIERARYLSLLWEKGKEDGVLETIVSASILIALTLEPTEELSWFSLPMTKALIITNRYKLAKKWIGLKLENSKLSYVDIGEVYGLMMLLIMVGEDLPDPYNIINVTDIWEDITKSDIVSGNNFGKILVIMDSLGKKIPEGKWLGLIEKEEKFHNIKVSSSALRYQLREAVKQNRTGEVVMLSLVILSNGVKKTDYLDLYEVISALRLTGLKFEAKKIAIEASLSLIN